MICLCLTNMSGCDTLPCDPYALDQAWLVIYVTLNPWCKDNLMLKLVRIHNNNWLHLVLHGLGPKGVQFGPIKHSSYRSTMHTNPAQSSPWHRNLLIPVTTGPLTCTTGHHLS